jgi:hypothetical protein
VPGVRFDGLDDEVEFVGAVDLSRHAVVLARRDEVGFAEVVQPINPVRRVISHDEHAQERYSVRESRSRWLALKLNMERERTESGSDGSRALLSAPLRGYPADSSGPGYHHSAAHA